VKPARGCNEKQLLTPDQEREARRMLADGAGHRDVAQAIGITYRRLLTRFEDQLADAKVGRGRGGGPRRHAWRRRRRLPKRQPHNAPGRPFAASADYRHPPARRNPGLFR
jgi:hypothetical protein